ncbi:MAG: LolA family protein [Thermoguttaceae bacterium]
MLPILPILCLLAAPPFFHGSDDRPAWVPGPPVYQQPGSSPASAAGNPAVAAAPHAGGAVAPQAVLEAAVRSLESRRSVSAKIHQQIQLFDKQLVGRGDYLELRGGPVPLIRLEMQVQIGDQVSSLLQVCDGQTLWSYTKLADKETLTRLDAVRATAALQQAAQRPDRNPAAVLPGLGGLSKSLRALDANFRFTTAERRQFRQAAVWRLQGGWQPAQLARLLPKQAAAIAQGKPADFRRLPQYLPDRVVLILGQEDLFPYRIEYRRTVDKKDGPSADDEGRLLVSIDLDDVRLNFPIDRTRFFYNPGSGEPADQTNAFLQSLGVKQ